jgi:hypothetical protein
MIEEMRTQDGEVEGDESIFESVIRGLWEGLVGIFIPEEPLKITLTEREQFGAARILSGIHNSRSSMLAKDVFANFKKEYDREELNKIMKYLLREGEIRKYRSPNGLCFEPCNTWKNFKNRDFLNSAYR